MVLTLLTGFANSKVNETQVAEPNLEDTVKQVLKKWFCGFAY